MRSASVVYSGKKKVSLAGWKVWPMHAMPRHHEGKTNNGSAFVIARVPHEHDIFSNVFEHVYVAFAVAAATSTRSILRTQELVHANATSKHDGGDRSVVALLFKLLMLLFATRVTDDATARHIPKTMWLV